MQSTAESPIAELEAPTQRREGVLEQILRQLNDIASMQRDLSDRMSHMEGAMGQIVQRQNSIEQSQRDLMQSQLALMQSQRDLSDRMSRMEGSADQQSRQINSIDTRLTNLEARFFTALCWIVGIQITTLLTLGTLILFKFGD